MIQEDPCPCTKCRYARMIAVPLPWQAFCVEMIVCPTCGNKRCPHADDHFYPCTGSNEPGQAGSAYQ